MPEVHRIRVEVLGASYFLTTTESEEYIYTLQQKLNGMLAELQNRHTSVSLNDALVLTCLNLLDNCAKTEENADHIRSQLTEYLQDAARARIELDEASREIERLKRELEVCNQMMSEDKRR